MVPSRCWQELRRVSAGGTLAAALACAPSLHAAEVVINFDGISTSTYVQGAPVASYLAGFGVTTPNTLTVMDGLTYANYIASPTKNVLTGGDGRNPTVMTLEFAEPVSDFRFTRAGTRGENSPSGTVAGPWTATAYNASNVSLGSVSEGLTSFFGSRPAQVFSVNAAGIRKVVFEGYDDGYAGINTPFITLLTFTTGAGTGEAWTARAAMPTARSSTAAAVVGNNIYVLGGYQGGAACTYLPTNQMYDSVQNSWTSKAAMPWAPDGAGAATINGIVYAVGGLTGCGSSFATLGAYDPVQDTWTLKANMPTARGRLGVAAVGGILYAIGGGLGSAVTGVVEAYNPATNTWATRAPMPTPRFWFSSAEANGIIYIFGGWNGSNGVATVEAYDPGTNTWSTKAPMPVPRVGTTAATINGRIYVVGSDYTSPPSTVVGVYDPATNTWSTGPAMLEARGNPGAAVVGTNLYVIGGWSGTSVLASTESLTLSSSNNTLTVTRAGSGTGTVTSSPAGIDCGSTCGANFTAGASVTLTASPAADSRFTGWSGACSGSGSCVVTMSASLAVTATFQPKFSSTTSLTSGTNPSPAGQPVTFTATVSGSGGTPTGTVTIKEGATVHCGPLALASGQAQCSVPGLAAGAHSMTAEYSGDATYQQGTSGVLSHTVSQSASALGYGLATSATHTLAVDALGRVFAWGSDHRGQLGLGRTVTRPTPLQITGMPPISHVAMARHVLAVDLALQVWSWGENACGQLGPREESVSTRPSRVSGARNMTTVAAGLCFSLALKSDGTVWGWGAVPGYDGTHFRQIPGLANIIDIAAGSRHALALAANGTLYAFGDNADGQLGLGITGPPRQVSLVQGIPGVARIAAGDVTSMVMHSDNSLSFWGRHQDGTLVTAPRGLANLGGTASAFSVTGNRPYAGRLDGVVLGYGAASNNWASEYSGFNSVEQLAAGNAGFVLGINSSGQLSAAGVNTGGQLGLGHVNAQAGVVAVPGFSSTRMVRTGALDGSVIALLNNGSIWFWGADSAGESGDGALIGSSVPRQVTLSPQARMVAAGDSFSAALDVNGLVYGWGDNSSGVFGPTRVSRSTPLQVPSVSAVAIAAGPRVMAYLHADGTVSYSGILPPLSAATAPTAIPGFAGIQAIAVGENTIYGLTSDGRVFAVGENGNGELGNGTISPSAAAVQVQGITGTAARISAARFRAGAVTTDGRVYSWGAGPLGNGGPAGSITPTQVSGLVGAADISVGAQGTLVKRNNGSLAAWGDMGLADGSATPLSAYNVTFPSAVASIQAGRGSGLGFIVSNTGLVWGFGRYGALLSTPASIGDGAYVRRDRPAVLLAPGGAGNIESNDWFFDLDPSSAESVPPQFVPRMLGESRLFAGGEGLSVGATIRYKASDFNRPVGNYVLGLVRPEFFDAVKTAASPPAKSALKALASKNGGFIPVQLTPNGWATLSGQLIAFSQGLASAAGGATNILNGIPATDLSGSRFCIGYGETTDSMLNAGTLVEVLQLEGATAASSTGQNCVVPGVYIDGPRGSRQGSPVSFKALVVGAGPGGTVQFRDGSADLLAPQSIVGANPAVSTAAITVLNLAVGPHSIGGFYSGDAQNAAAIAAFPVRHVVEAVAPGQSRTTLEGPTSSLLGSEVAFVAAVIGNAPTGTVQFKKFNDNLGSPVPLVGGVAILRVSSLEIGVPRIISAVYSGDGANASSVSNDLHHSVSLSINSTVNLASSATTTTAGTAIRLTATVSGNSPTGSVVFRDGPALLATIPLVQGSATLDTQFDAGVHVLTADYSGDNFHSPSTSDALFQQVSIAYPLAVARAGTGTGTVASSPAGTIDCGATCSANVAPGTGVTLIATPAGGSSFGGWSGDCSGSGSCSITMNAARSVTANFTLNSYTVTPSAGANGSISPNTVQTIGHGGTATFTVSPSAGYTAFVGGTCGGSLVGNTYTTSPVTANCTVQAGFSNVTFTVTPSAGANGTISPSTPQTVASGGTATFTVAPSAGYTASVDGTCGGALVGNTYTTNAITANCTVAAAFALANPARLFNISTRGPVNTGDNVMIGGFIISGSAPKSVLIRARGPSLAQFGVPNVLANPQLQLFRGQTSIGFNDNWGDVPNPAAIQATGFAPESPQESAILATLAPGGYTAIVSGVGNTTGIAIVEVFEVGEATTGLLNISTRGPVQTGDHVMIGGFIIAGDGPQTVVIRARGPSLSQFGVPGVLANPLLQIFQGQTPVASNDNWVDAPNKAAIEASTFAPENANESAILVTLQPGGYTAIVTGVGGGTGVAIVEVFKANP